MAEIRSTGGATSETSNYSALEGLLNAVGHTLQQKQAGLPATVKTFPPPRAVPDLMEAFRKSLAAEQAETANDDGKPAKAARPKKSKAKVEGQREMLLPIAGGKTEAEAKPAAKPRRKAG